MSDLDPIALRGSPGSPYTRKMVALLRYWRLPYRYLVRAADAAGLPRPKVELLPTMYLPGADGVLEAVTDSTPLIRRLQPRVPARSVLPADPVLALVDAVLEDYGDEWLTKPMFHYRWAYGADAAKAAGILPRWREFGASEDAVAEVGRLFADRQIGRLHVVGSNVGTAALIEDGYRRFLDAFDDHLRRHPFLFGARPAAADFAIYGQLTQLARFDPTPAAETLARAPRVVAWVELMEDLSGIEPADDDWLDRASVRHSLAPLLAEVARTYVPVMHANARALATGADLVEATVDGQVWTQAPFPYQGKCLTALRAQWERLPVAERTSVEDVLGPAAALFAVD
jgi:glutathione S-transferase